MSDLETPPFEDRPPESDRVTPYDELHFVTYLRLLDAEAAGADWRKAVWRFSELNPIGATEPGPSMTPISRAPVG